MAGQQALFRIEGAPELQKALEDLGRFSFQKNALRAATKKALEPVEARAFELAPKGGIESADPGGGAESITIKTTPGSLRRGEIEMAVGPTRDKFYMLFQEFGTAFHGPQAFLRPAWDQVGTQRILRILGKELWIAIEKTRKRVARAQARAFKKAAS